MARQQIEQLTDDLDGSPADRTVRFGWSGTEYEIDLTDAHAEELEAAVARFVDAARTVGGGRRGGARRGAGRGRGGAAAGTGGGRRAAARDGRSDAGGPDVDLAAVRAWAQDNGMAVSARGRISAAVLEAYQAAQA